MRGRSPFTLLDSDRRSEGQRPLHTPGQWSEFRGGEVFCWLEICVAHIRESTMDLGTGKLVTTMRGDHLRGVTILESFLH